jgi:integrase
MFEDMYLDAAAVRRLRSCVLGRGLEEFCSHLEYRGYTAHSIRLKIGLLGRLARWMEAKGLGVRDLDERLARSFVAVRRRRGYRCLGVEHTVLQLIEHLRSSGALARPLFAPECSRSAVHLTRYETHLRKERALAPGTIEGRLSMVRRFAAWLSATEPRTGVPPAGLLPGGLVRRAPYVYSDEEILRIVEESSRLRSPTGLRALTFATLFGLLAVTGMRLSEALGLDLDDVDLRGGVLTVRRAKFGKSRFVPLHESTCAALGRYARRRDRLSACAASPAFFVSERGARVRGSCAEQTFAVVSRAVGLRPPAERRDYRGHGPRLHDMRHRLVVRTLVRWYREGRDVERELPKLVAYLGHAHVAYTYWYFEAVPELLHLAGERAALRPETSP